MSKDLIVVEEAPSLPTEWNYDDSIKKFHNLYKEVREKGAEALTELWIAHQLLTQDSKRKVDRRWPDKTFASYCEDIGIEERTAFRWLHQYLGMPQRGILTNVSIPSVSLPEGLFEVITIDPPWPYGGSYDLHSHRVDSPYPEMSLEELAKLEIPASDNSILWLWTTNAFMHEAYHLLEAWGFEPKTILTWFKERTGVGYWLRGQTEHCILAVRGSPQITHEAQGTALLAKASDHSRKPDEFYELVESLCPGKKLDMFARRERDGWEVWGNEV